MKGEQQGKDKPIAKPPYPLPAIFSPKRKTRYSTRVEWGKVDNGRRQQNVPATASRENT